jgi:hypothetical protein
MLCLPGPHTLQRAEGHTGLHVAAAVLQSGDRGSTRDAPIEVLRWTPVGPSCGRLLSADWAVRKVAYPPPGND